MSGECFHKRRVQLNLRRLISLKRPIYFDDDEDHRLFAYKPIDLFCRLSTSTEIATRLLLELLHVRLTIFLHFTARHRYRAKLLHSDRHFGSGGG